MNIESIILDTTMEEKKCNHCHLIKRLEDFWFNKKRNYYYPKCKRCKYEISKQYASISNEKKAEYDKRYREKHADKLKEKKKEEYEKNKDKYIKRQITYRNTIEGKIKHNLRTRISNSIKRKTNTSFEFYSI
jgi:hypothetical protein